MVPIYLGKGKSRCLTIHLLMLDNAKFFSNYPEGDNEFHLNNPVYHFD